MGGAGESFIAIFAGSLVCSGAFDCNRDFDTHGGVLLWLFIMVYMFKALGAICDEYFVPSLEVIVAKLKLSNDVAGATFMAAGSSAPELFTSLVSTFLIVNEGGVGAIVGSAIFNILVIVGATAVVACKDQDLEIWWYPLCRDSCFYSIAIAELLVVLADEKVHWYEGAIMVSSYLVYCLYMKLNPQIVEFFQLEKKVAPDQEVVAATECAPELPEIIAIEPNGAVVEVKPEVALRTAGAGNKEAPPEPPGQVDSAVEGRGQTLSALGCPPDEEPRPPEPLGTNIPVPTAPLDDRRLLIAAGDCGELKSSGRPAPLPGTEKGDSKGVVDLCNDPGTPTNSNVRRRDAGGATPPARAELVPKRMDSLPGAINSEKISRLHPEAASPTVKGDDRMEPASSITSVTMSKHLNRIFSKDITESATASRYLNRLEAIEKVPSNAGRPSWSYTENAALDRLKRQLERENSGRASDVGTASNNSLPKLDPRFRHKPDSMVVEVSGEGELPATTSGDAGGSSGGCCRDPLLVFWEFTMPYADNYCWLLFFLSILYIGLCTYLMVDATNRLGTVLNVPTLAMALVFLAAGTSIPDALGSIAVAKQGEGDMAIANALGSNVFDILIGLGVPWTIKTAMGKEVAFKGKLDELIWDIILLCFVLVLFVGALVIHRWRLTRPVGLILLFFYLLFLVYNVLAVWAFKWKDPDDG